MDFDRGSVRNKCEQATASDHSYNGARSDVALSMNGDEELFKDVMISNAENTSDSVSLNYVQKSISVALFHENTNHSALGMHNYYILATHNVVISNFRSSVA